MPAPVEALGVGEVMIERRGAERGADLGRGEHIAHAHGLATLGKGDPVRVRRGLGVDRHDAARTSATDLRPASFASSRIFSSAAISFRSHASKLWRERFARASRTSTRAASRTLYFSRKIRLRALMNALWAASLVK